MPDGAEGRGDRSARPLHPAATNHAERRAGRREVESGRGAAHIFSSTMPLQCDEPPNGLHLNCVPKCAFL